MSGIRISQWTATAGIKEGTEELVRSGALPLVWGEALETRLFPESSGRLAIVRGCARAAGMGWCVLFVGGRRPRMFFAGVFKSHVFFDTQD